MTWAQVFGYWALLCVAFVPLWAVIQMISENKRSKQRIAKWQELGERAANGDLDAFEELLRSGPKRSGERF
jgi:hypothetical protein